MSLIPEHGFKIVSTSDKVTLGAPSPDKSKHANHAKNVKIITIQKLQSNNNNTQKWASIKKRNNKERKHPNII